MKKKLEQRLNGVSWAVLRSPDKKQKPEEIIGEDNGQNSLHDVFSFMSCVTSMASKSALNNPNDDLNIVKDNK